MSAYKNLGNCLKEARIAQGLSQKEVGDHLGIHPQYISNYERGLCSPPMYSFDKLMKLLKADREKVVTAMLEDSRIEIEGRVYKNRRRA